MNNFNMLSQFIFSFKYFITNLTFEKFQIFCHKSYIWKVLIMNNCNILSPFIFVLRILPQISHLIGFHHEQFLYAISIYIVFQIFYHKSNIWNVLIMNNCNMLSQFIFSFKLFITNVTFERFSSWTIVICFLNSCFLSRILPQISPNFL